MSSPGWSRTTDSPASASQVITGVCCHYNSYSQVRKDTGWHGAVAQLPHHINANSLSSCQHRDSAAWLGPVPRCRHPRNSRLSRWKVSYSSPGFNSTGGKPCDLIKWPREGSSKIQNCFLLKIHSAGKEEIPSAAGRTFVTWRWWHWFPRTTLIREGQLELGLRFI